MTIELINKIFYYSILYLPLLFWILYKTTFAQSIFDKLYKYEKTLKSETQKYTISRFIGATAFISIIAYGVLGAIGAIFQTLIGFKEMYHFNDNLFILYILKSAFELSIFTSIIFSFKIVPKYWLLHIVYGWIFLNIYYQIFGKFELLDGAKKIVLPQVFG